MLAVGLLAAVCGVLTASSAGPTVECVGIDGAECQQAATEVIGEVELTHPKRVAHLRVQLPLYCTRTVGGGAHCLSGDARVVATFTAGSAATYGVVLAGGGRAGWPAPVMHATLLKPD
jgi:hypothetical protein